MGIKITVESINEFGKWLQSEERSTGTISKYIRDLKQLMNWLEGRGLTKENIAFWKEELVQKGYEPVSINSMLAAVNTYCRYRGLDIKVKFLRVQRRLFRDEYRELNRDEYKRLILTAQNKGNIRLAMLIETIAATGIRVSEVQYITVEAAMAGRTQIAMKGKIRDIMIPGKLCKKILKYAKKQRIASGPIFITKNGKNMSRKQIWAEMKSICKDADVEESKVFPHNLRHLFARVFYRVTHDIVKLADVLGHSSIETTRIYLLTTGVEHEKQLERMEMVW